MAETTTRRTSRRKPPAEAAPPAPDTPTPDAAPPAEPEALAERPAPARPRDDDDPNIGRAVPASWDEAGFDNGHRYRCEGGRVVERIG